MIAPGDLTEIRGESNIILQDKDRKTKTIHRYRDLVMHWRGGLDLVILAAEAQDKIHYAMPVKNMVYDSLSYTEQIRRIQKQHSEKSDITSVSAEEFLSGFLKDDHIYPVITLVFYYDIKEWDGAKDLYSMMGLTDQIKKYPRLKQYIPNYHINLVDAGRIEDVERFHTDLQEVMGMLRYRRDKEGLQNYVKEHAVYFSDLDMDSYYAISAFLKSERLMNKIEEEHSRGKEMHLDMCKALEDLYEDGIEKGKRDIAHNLDKMGMTTDRIAEAVGESISVVSRWLSQTAEPSGNKN